MNEFFTNSAFFGVLISLVSYGAGEALKKKFKLGIFNPLLIAVVATIIVISVFHIDYEVYNESAKYLSYLLTPATVFAVPLYERIDRLKENPAAIISGIVSGVITSLASILAMAAVFHLSHEEYVTMLPKSITTAIGIGVSEELGGYVAITAAVIIVTGVLGNILAETVLKLFRITDPVAKGIAIGTAAHAIGTAKAMEIGETEGAMSSLSIVVSGILTVIGASVFAGFI